jgi:hypothetical protein
VRYVIYIYIYIYDVSRLRVNHTVTDLESVADSDAGKRLSPTANHTSLSDPQTSVISVSSSPYQTVVSMDSAYTLSSLCSMPGIIHNVT